MYQTGETIKNMLTMISTHRYVLPAIQREFVWKPEQICSLFDSLMQGFPFGTFLFWQVEARNSGMYRFYGFVREYHERDSPHCPEISVMPNTDLTAVLDGQQRLTALNIGLCGSHAIKEPGRWRSNPNAFPRKYLYLDLLASQDDEEQGRYKFRFLEEKRVSREPAEGEAWFRVSDILTMSDGPAMNDWIVDRGLVGDDLKKAYKMLDRLFRVIHNENIVAFYQEKSQDIERVLSIFIRMNSGGTVLSYSDLLLSIAVAQWKKLDARKEIHELVDQLNEVGPGFSFSKDFVLKAGLMLCDIKSVGFKVENFTQENMATLESNWHSIRAALLQTVELISSFGFSSYTMRADSGLLPIAFYVYQKDADNFVTHTKYRADRESIQSWLVRSLLKASGIWGSGLDTLLTALRSTMQEAGHETFPVAALEETMARRGKSLIFGPAEINELVELEYGDRRTFPLLSLLYPHVDLRNQFHVDHVFPQAGFARPRLGKVGLAPEAVERCVRLRDRLPNLQLLEGPFNNEKRAKAPADWLREFYGTDAQREAYCRTNDLGVLPADMTGFEDFYRARREALLRRVTDLLGGGDQGSDLLDL